MSHYDGIFSAIAHWMGTLWHDIKVVLCFHMPAEETHLLPLRMGRLHESIDLSYPLIDPNRSPALYGGQSNAALLKLMKTIEERLANPPQSITSDVVWTPQEQPQYDVPTVTYDTL